MKVDLLLTLRLKQMRDKGLEGLSFEDLSIVFDYLFKRKKIQNRISQQAELIFQTTDDEIIRVLAFCTQRNAFNSHIEDYL